MFLTMSDLSVVSSSAESVTLMVRGLKNPVTLLVRKYENGTLINIPWVSRERFGSANYGALKAVLAPVFGRIETRTETDPRFKEAASARSGSNRRAQKVPA